MHPNQRHRCRPRPPRGPAGFHAARCSDSRQAGPPQAFRSRPRVLAGNNEHTVIPGKVYRSAQPRRSNSRVIAEKKIRTVINLRGCCPDMGWYMGDARATNAAGISQEDLTFSAKRYPHPWELNRLIEVFDRTEYPVILHCARGADRTGLASVIVRLLLTDDDLPTARRQLWPRYGHVAVGRTALLDEFFDYYAAWLASTSEPHTPERFRRWLAELYCPGPFRAAEDRLADPVVMPAGRGFVVTIRATPLGGAVDVLARRQRRHPATLFALHQRRRDRSPRARRFVRPDRLPRRFNRPRGRLPAGQGGKHMLHADLLDAQPIDLLDTNFAQYGSEPIVVDVMVK